MARRLRLEFEGAIYHITMRGNERSDIFKHERDCVDLEEYIGLSRRAIGQKLGLQDGSGLSRLKEKLDERLAGSRKLLKQLRLKCSLNH